MRGFSMAVGAMVLAFFIAPALSPVPAARVKVGETISFHVESPHPVPFSGWRGGVKLAGASFIKLRIAEAGLGQADELRLLDGAGTVIFSHFGPLPAGVWFPSIEGDSASLEVLPAPGGRPWGVRVEEAAAGFIPLAIPPSPESVCGLDDRKDPACYPDMQPFGAPVGRMLFNDGGWYVCTGSLVSPSGHFLTNNHCISKQAAAESLEVKWLYQYSGCSSGSTGVDSVTNVADLLITDEELDMSLLLFRSDNPASRYGFLTAGPQDPTQGEVIWIPQHPGGNPKKYAVASDLDDGGISEIIAANLDGNGPGTDIGYFADTQGGSSGSPVLREDGTLAALHHFGTGGLPCDSTWMNQGVKMSLIHPMIAPFLGAIPLSASASAAPASGSAPLDVEFSAVGRGGTPPYTYSWAFGDGASSELRNPAHTYSAAGVYSVLLTVRDSLAAEASDVSISITVSAPPCSLSCTAEAVPVSGSAPLTVSFSAQASSENCSGSPAFSWDFGDGAASGEQSPVHVFAGAGTFSWAVSILWGGETCEKTGTVVVAPGLPGDCDGNGTVSIGEVQKAINMFLGVEPVGCFADCDGNGLISIGEVQKVINAFLGTATSC